MNAGIAVGSFISEGCECEMQFGIKKSVIIVVGIVVRVSIVICSLPWECRLSAGVATVHPHCAFMTVEVVE